MEARVTVFRIRKCGYFNHRCKNAEFGSIDEILKDLKTWVDKKALHDTLIFMPEDGSDLEPTYCVNIGSGGTNYLITTWNGIPTTEDNSVAAIKGNASVGAINGADIETNKFGKEYIPGYATYFWIMPQKNAFATIQFLHIKNGKRNFEKYLQEFMSKFTRFVVCKQNNSSEILGYKKPQDEDISYAIPQFQTIMCRNPAQLDIILGRHDKISRVIRRDSLELAHEAEKSLLLKIGERIGLNGYSSVKDIVDLKYEIPMHPTLNELNTIIRYWEKQEDSLNSIWDDIGFKISGEIYWLSHSRAKITLEFNVEFDNKELINQESLIHELTRYNETIGALIK